MKNNNIWITIKKELRSKFRDKKSLMAMMITPLLIPVFVFAIAAVNDAAVRRSLEETTSVVGINIPVSDELEEIADAMNLEFIYMPEEELQDEYDKENIEAFVIKTDGVLNIYFDENSHESSTAALVVGSAFEIYSNHLAAQYLNEQGIDTELVFGLVNYEMKPELSGGMGLSELISNAIIGIGFTFAVMAILATASTSATDSVAGEKERGTLETLLTFPITGIQLVTGKYLANLIACLMTAVLSIILSLVSVGVAYNVFSVFEGKVFSVDIVTVLIGLGILTGLALFVSAVSIAIASYSKTFKEAQGTLSALQMIVMAPLFMQMAGVEMSTTLAAIPIINHVMILSDIFADNLNVNYLLIMFASTLVIIVLSLRYIAKLFKSEKILFSL